MRPKVRRPPGTAYDERYLAPAFRATERTSVMFWGAVACGTHSSLVAVRKRGPEERTHKGDRLGMNSKQYCDEIILPHLFPLVSKIRMLYAMRYRRQVKVIEDGAGIHNSKETCEFRKRYCINRLPWPPYSPDMNLIENVWSLLKRRLRRKWINPEKRPRTREELIVAAQLEWDALPWPIIYTWFERMPNRIKTLIRRRGGATRW